MGVLRCFHLLKDGKHQKSLPFESNREQSYWNYQILRHRFYNQKAYSFWNRVAWCSGNMAVVRTPGLFSFRLRLTSWPWKELSVRLGKTSVPVSSSVKQARLINTYFPRQLTGLCGILWMMLVNVNEFCECQKFLHYNVMTLRTVQELYTQIPGQMSSWEIEGLE